MKAMIDFANLAEQLLPSVIAAGAVEMRHYREGCEVEYKSDHSPVTEADREAEALLIEGLRAAAPGIPVVAEERAAAGHVPGRGAAYFLVDPLDGTREFIKQSGEFTVNIGLVVDGTPVFGLIYAPAIEAFFVTLGEKRVVEAKIPVDARATGLSDYALRPLATRTPNHDALTVVESRSHGTPEDAAFLAQFKVAEVKRAGSSLKFCQIARGEADMYVRLGPTCEWDTAAGQAILTVAGGTVTTLDGAPLRYGNAAGGYVNPSFVAWAGTPIAPQNA